MSIDAIATGAKLTVHSTIANAGGSVVPTDAVSNSFNVVVGTASTISTPVAVGSVPSTAFSQTAGTPSASTGAVAVFSFKVNDDATITPNDGNPTLVSQIIFRQSATQNSSALSDWRQAIGGAILSDGNSSNDYVLDFSILANAGNLTATTITFPNIDFSNGHLGYVADSPNPSLSVNSKTYTLSIWLKPSLSSTLPITIDGKAFGFDVQSIADVTVDLNGTDLASGTALTPSGNTVNVVASKINFMTLAPPSTTPVDVNSAVFSAVPSATFTSSAYIFFPFDGTVSPSPINTANGPIGAEAVDVNGNRDLNYNGAVTGFSAANGLTFANDPLSLTQSFSGGTLAFNTNFYYTSGDNQDGKITMSTTTAPALSSTSPTITILSSQDSYVYFDPLFTSQTFNNFVNQQATALPATDPNDGTLATMARLILSDGGGAAYNATIASAPASRTHTPGDLDKGFTQISDISFSLTGTGVGDLRTLALYDNAGNKISSDVAASASVSFTGLSIKANDDATTTFSIRGTFQQVVGADHDNIQFKVSGVTWHALGGSKPYNYNNAAGPYFGGVNSGDASLSNIIDVVATSLDFLTQPSPYAGINEPIGTNPLTSQPYSYGNSAAALLTSMPTTTPGKVTARDKFRNVDTGFAPTSIFIKDASDNLLGAPVNFNFVSGILNLNGMSYPFVGNGAVKIIATAPAPSGTIDSSVPRINTTGTITATTSSTTITGVGTQFLTDLIPGGAGVGSTISDSNGNLIGTVASITDNATLTLTANALVAVTAGQYSANSVPCQKVDVLDVTVTQDLTNAINTNGTFPPTTSLKGGNKGSTLFGLQFHANNIAGAEPYIKRVAINFDVPYSLLGTTIFTNFIVRAVYTTAGGTITADYTTANGVTLGNKTGNLALGLDQVVLDLGITPISLGNTTNASAYFYLIADVDPSVNLSTTPITPSFADHGYGNSDDQNAVVSNGTATALGGQIKGTKYTFASTKPPILLTAKTNKTSPYAGQPNVDPFLKKIVLQFDTKVGSFDGGGPGNAELWWNDRANNKTVKVGDLNFNTTTPWVPGGSNPTTPQAKAAVDNLSNTVSPIYDSLLYDVQLPATVGPGLTSVSGTTVLISDEVYFVKLIKGSYDAVSNTGQGIVDFGENIYGGISTNSTLYFKVSSNKAPVLSFAQSTFNTTTLGTITTKFDQTGTAYFLIVKAGDPSPLASDVTGVTNYQAAHPTATVAASLNFPITIVNTNQTFTFPASFNAGQAYDVYIIS
jgi:hypothetical protein